MDQRYVAAQHQQHFHLQHTTALCTRWLYCFYLPCWRCHTSACLPLYYLHLATFAVHRLPLYLHAGWDDLFWTLLPPPPPAAVYALTFFFHRHHHAAVWFRSFSFRSCIYIPARTCPGFTWCVRAARAIAFCWLLRALFCNCLPAISYSAFFAPAFLRAIYVLLLLAAPPYIYTTCLMDRSSAVAFCHLSPDVLPATHCHIPSAFTYNILILLTYNLYNSLSPSLSLLW